MVRLKSSDEIAQMHVAGQILAKALWQMQYILAPGVSTAQIDKVGEQFVLDHGAVPSLKGYRPPFSRHAFQHATCISVNDQVIHGVPGPYELQAGDVVKIDMAISKNGWFADAAITSIVMEQDEHAELRLLIDTTEQALLDGIAASKAGATLGDIGAAIQKAAAEYDFGVVREAAGHGIGQSIHESGLDIMNVGVPGTGVELCPGMTFCIEPMFTLGFDGTIIMRDNDPWTIYSADGSIAAHWEHTVAITENGPLILTALP
jgi:methionyl aminopeptidase